MLNIKIASQLLTPILTLFFVLSSTSCVTFITPDNAPISPERKSVSPIGIAVSDQRKNTSGLAGNRYLGRCRLGLYGIPSSLADVSPLSDRITKHLEAGFKQKGIDVRTVTAANGQKLDSRPEVFVGTGAVKVLQITVSDDTWIDFANPLFGKESILYFNATAQVVTPTGKLLASASRKLERNFRYDTNDNFINQAVLALQPEFAKLINEKSIQAALAP